MKTEQEYIKDLSEIRSMMERSVKFLSLSGLSGIMAGIYALIGAYVAHEFFYNETQAFFSIGFYGKVVSGRLFSLVLLAIAVLGLALGTAIFLSSKKASKNNEKVWNPAAKKLIHTMAPPLLSGGALILILIEKGHFALIAPMSLIFYGLSIINASKFTFGELKYLGYTEIILGILSIYFAGYGLYFWAFGFGIMHIAYGIYMHWKYEK